MKELINGPRLAAIIVIVALAVAAFAAYPSAITSAEASVARERTAPAAPVAEPDRTPEIRYNLRPCGAGNGADKAIDSRSKARTECPALREDCCGGVVATVSQPGTEAEDSDPIVTTEPAIEPVISIIEPVMEPVEPIIEPVIEPVEPIIEPVMEPVEPIIEPVMEPVEPIIEPVIEPVEPVIDPVEPVIEPVIDTVEPVMEPVGDVVEPVTEPVGDVVEPVTEPAGDVVNPVGSIDPTSPDSPPESGQTPDSNGGAKSIGSSSGGGPSTGVSGRGAGPDEDGQGRERARALRAAENGAAAPEAEAGEPGADARSPAPASGEGLFTPSELRDSALAILTGLAALIGAWFWLRRQQREEALMLATADVPADNEEGRPRPAEHYGDPRTWRLRRERHADAHRAGHHEGKRVPLCPLCFDGPSGPGGEDSGRNNETPVGAAIAMAMREPHGAGTATHHFEANGHSNGATGGAALGAALPGVATLAGKGSVVEMRPPACGRVSVVIPAKNEAESLPEVLKRLPSWLHEVILVDGLSEDQTSEVARLCLPGIRVVAQSGRGKGNALREGFATCTGDVVVALDADGSMDPTEIGAFVAMLEAGFDYVKGSRMVVGGSSTDLTGFRRFGNWLFKTLTNFIHHSRYSDLCYGYFAFRRGTIDSLGLHSSGFEIETEINIKAHQAGLRTAEIPSREHPRRNGASNLNALRDGLRILYTILRTSFSRKMAPPAHMAALAVIGLSLGALILFGAPDEATPANSAAGVLAASTATLEPVDDAYVGGDVPTTNFGSDFELQSDGSPVRQSFLKFDLLPLAGQTVNQATLRMFVTNGSGGTNTLYGVPDDTWSEHTITFNNRPANGAVITTFTPGTSTGVWRDLDVTAAVAASAGSLMSVSLDTASSDGFDFSSTEEAGNHVHLVVQYGGGGATPTPSATITPTGGTPTPTLTAPVPTATPTPTSTAPPPPGGMLSLNPIDDAHVAGDLPDSNFSSAAILQSDASPVRESFLKFDLAPLAGEDVWRATLRMYVMNRSRGAQAIKEVSDNSWSEFAITFNSKPAKGAVVTTFTPSTNRVWREVDITTFVAGRAGSVMSIAIDTTNTDGYDFNSAEASTNRVELVVSYGATPIPTPTATPTVTPTPTGIATPTPTGPPPEAFSFGAAGDLGATSNTSAVLNAVGPDVNFFLALGDLSYSDVTPESAWCNFVKDRVGSSYPFELISGNHEDDGPDGLITNFASCLPHRLGSLSGTYAKQFYFDYPAASPLARFIQISPNLTFPGEGTWSYNEGTTRYTWVADAIDQARSSGIRWVIVSMHKYCISMVSGNCQVGSDIMNLMIEKKVDLFFQAHDHAFYRSKQLAHRTGCSAVSPGSFDADCVVDSGSDGQYTKGNGTVIITAGSGGKSINSVSTSDPEAPYFVSWMGSNANPTYGFLKVTVSATSLSGEFVRGSGGSYTDAFTIQ